MISVITVCILDDQACCKGRRLRRLPRLELESDSHDHDTQLAVAKSAQWIESA
jgi:hypothetical protein